MFSVPDKISKKQFEVSYSPERTELIKRMKLRRENRNTQRFVNTVQGSMDGHTRSAPRDLPTISKSRPYESHRSMGI